MATNNTKPRNKVPLDKNKSAPGRPKVPTKSSHPAAALVTQNQDCLSPTLLQKTISNGRQEVPLEVSFSFSQFETKLASSVDSQLKMAVVSGILNLQRQIEKNEARTLSLLSLAIAENLQLKTTFKKNQDTIAALQIHLAKAAVLSDATTQNQDHNTVAEPDLFALSPYNNNLLLSSNALMNPTTTTTTTTTTSCPLSGFSEALGSVENDGAGVIGDVSVDKKIRPPPGYWKEHFWTQELQDLVAERDRCYRRWRHARGIDRIIIWYVKRREAGNAFRKAVQAAKRDAYKKYLSEKYPNYEIKRE
ncbi:hypothetical protein BD770DRAFT_403906 [Pilaira anomala]|nr:hypothetical protein BD770DRAFT_403906 [Pilaira anomala]